MEQKDATPEETAISEINTGVYCFDNRTLFDALHLITNENAQGEYYLTDVIGILKQRGDIVAAYKMDNFDESMGVNDRIALAKANQVMRNRINTGLMQNGVTLMDPDSTYIDSDIKIGSDTVIEGGVSIKGDTTIGSDCFIGAHSEIQDSVIHDEVKVLSSFIEKSEMHTGSDIGPYSHLRPESEIGEKAHLGNFVEVKKNHKLVMVLKWDT